MKTIQKALEKQTRLEDKAVAEPGGTDSVFVYLGHLRNQAALARAVIEAAGDANIWAVIDHPSRDKLRLALTAWADQVNREAET